MSEFKVMQQAVQRQFDKMRKYDLFRADASKDELWDTYLSSFPAGTNRIYRQKAEYDCNCCKQFIRAVGNMVAIVDGKVETLWDIEPVSVPEYRVVSGKLAELVRSKAIRDVFLHYEPAAGVEANRQVGEDNAVITWNHFHLKFPKELVSKTDLDTVLGQMRTSQEVFQRSLTEITNEAIETVLDLIKQNSLYRGEEHQHAVTTFSTAKKQYESLSDEKKKLFCWMNLKTVPVSVAKIRNTVIGTLLVDLSAGVDLEEAVKSFEAKVAPANYKRPTALVTKAMIEKAKQTVEAMGLTSALQRRYATVKDLTVNNILFVDRDTKKDLKGDVFADVSSSVSENLKNFDKVEEIPVEKFIADVLPTVKTLEVLVENRHAGNMMSLIAPVDDSAKLLFKWANPFSWSYAGDLADSIKQRVKNAGGNVTGDLRCSLSWFNYDDLDLHMKEPGGGHIFYASKLSLFRGALDVDMNAGQGTTRKPVENICYVDRKYLPEGVFKLLVNQFHRRETIDPGFVVEIEFDGTIHTMAYAKAVVGLVEVADIQYSKKDGFKIIKSLPAEQVSKEVWGVTTQHFHKASMVLLSPNHWDDRAVGNKHYFFMLDGCRNDGTARGFFNEFLHADLDQHRKVLEMVGAKVRTEKADRQLSGLGFSSTQRNTVVCRVKGSFNRVVKVIF